MLSLTCRMLKKDKKQTYLQKRNRHIPFENKLMVTKENRWDGRRDGLGVWNWHIHTVVDGMTGQCGPTV